MGGEVVASYASISSNYTKKKEISNMHLEDSKIAWNFIEFSGQLHKDPDNFIKIWQLVGK